MEYPDGRKFEVCFIVDLLRVKLISVSSAN